MTTRILKKIAFFRHLRQQELKRIISIAGRYSHKAGKIIFSKEEVGNHLFIVKSGKVGIYISPGFNRKKTFAYLKSGDFFGEMALLGGKIRSASAQAVTDCELMVIHRKNFRKLLFTDIKFTLRLLYTISERLQMADKEIEALLFKNVLGRLVRTLVNLCGLKKQTPISLGISQQELADFVGTTREPLSRALSLLKRNGTIESKNRHIIIKNLARLKSIRS
ncbi:MAG: Crp/Fnr family transcriptional regulator [bacterium]